MTNQAFTLVKETEKDKNDYYNKAAAHARSKEIAEHTEEFLANGGVIKKLPRYDEVRYG